MLARALKMAFWIVHDHLGKLVLANLVWSVTAAAPIALAFPAFVSADSGTIFYIGLPLVAIVVFAILPVTTAGLAHFLKTLIDARDGTLTDFAGGMRRYALPAIRLGAAYALAAGLLGTSAWFYPARFGDTAPILGYGLGAIAIWVLVFVGLTTIYAWPALVQKRAGVVAAVRIAIMLVIANPMFTIGLAIQIVLLTVVTVLMAPLFFLGYGVVLMAIVSSAYELLARTYAARDGAPPVDDAHDDYLNRGFRDLIFPWKG
jgi:uncharacterized membrane protein YesL